MIKRNANIFSKNDMDMGRTNLVKHHIELTDPIPFQGIIQENSSTNV